MRSIYGGAPPNRNPVIIIIIIIITRFISHVKSFTKLRIASAGWS